MTIVPAARMRATGVASPGIGVAGGTRCRTFAQPSQRSAPSPPTALHRRRRGLARLPAGGGCGRLGPCRPLAELVDRADARPEAGETPGLPQWRGRPPPRARCGPRGTARRAWRRSPAPPWGRAGSATAPRAGPGRDGVGVERDVAAERVGGGSPGARSSGRPERSCKRGGRGWCGRSGRAA